jgi:glycosyltransferase involved in cell wall biosynthesis
MVRSNLPDLMLRLWSPEFLAELRFLLADEHYDVVHVSGLELAGYLPAVSGTFTVFDENNVEYLLQQRAWHTDRGQPRRSLAALYSFVQWRRLRRWEAHLCALADAVLAVSERDAAALRALSGRDVAAVPNGIDLGSTPFRSPAAEPAPNLLFDGTMSFRPNHDAAVWFAREILPLVHERRPEARFWVVGREPLPELVAFNFRKNGVVVTGEVPSVRPYWERAGIYVLPMRMGGGVRFKALEAMARGVPLVSTELGVEGTPALPCRDYLRADRPTEFARGILRLLEDPDLRRDLATNARQAMAAHDWTRIAPRLLEVYERLAARHSAHSLEQ